MGSFRIGRKGAQHVYPEPARGGAPQLARNFASGPKDSLDLPSLGTEPSWASIDSVSAWSSLVTYAINDIVSADGLTWISLQNGNINNDPSASPAFWQENTIVPITPISTGVVVIHAMICAQNNEVQPENLLAIVRVNGVDLPVPQLVTQSFAAAPNGDGVVDILAEATGLPIGVRADVSLFLATGVTDNGITQTSGSTTIEVREMQAATG